MERIVGVVLAGGESRRFGRPKAFAKRKGMYFFQIAAEALRPAVQKLYIVSHPSLVLRFRKETNDEVIMDVEAYRGQGPLAGIYTVMKRTEADWVFVLPCDMPYMKASTVQKLVSCIDDAFDVIIAAHFDRIQPLVGAYHRRTINEMERLLEEGDNRMMSLLERARVRYVNEQHFQEESTVFQNINSPADHSIDGE
ncbi:molybdenum cofactor guanylyltransferase [Anoxybacteroides tepidamans]|uniref:molybdenum cofactor guanylyltransferase n=1 Tax=Anoxybacteroides tepidamans TaxID=265948 RepID=UPI000484B016|nr:molybdenum cofactor guanylyltransferase [Anoxybacillus tepidamans]